MAVKVYHDSDADLSIVQNKRITFVGYGNQGKMISINSPRFMQALTLLYMYCRLRPSK